MVEKCYWVDNTPNNIKIKKNGKKIECIQNINISNVVTGIFNTLLHDLIYNNLDATKIKTFCKNNVVLHKNNKNRSFPRNSKTPFTKWYIKGYSESTKYAKIINAILNKKTNALNKQLKKIAMTIISIDNG